MIMPDRYYLWGAGNIGKRAAQYLHSLSILDGIIDSDEAACGDTIYGLRVYSYESIKCNIQNHGVIITHLKSMETEKILRRDNVSFWSLSDFIAMFFWNRYKKNAIGFLDFPVTTHCTLNCRDCMQYIPYRSNGNILFEILKQDLEMLFGHVSFVGEISIIGGEPFLYGQLLELLEFINANYRERIGSLVITTNGTITPDFQVLELCRNLGVFISISDYSETLPWLSDKIVQFESAAKGANIRVERKRWSWSEPGKFNSLVDLRDCAQTHMQLANGKLWRCTLMSAGHAAGFCMADGDYDYFDLSCKNNDIQSFFNYEPSKRTSQCGKCLYQYGKEIPHAIQIGREKK